MKTVYGNIFKHLSRRDCVMLHVCNDAGGYGGGPKAIATQVKSNYPNAHEAFLVNGKLGDISCDDQMKVFNLVAQEGYGKRGKRYLNYGALSECLSGFMQNYCFELQDRDVKYILIPFNMGADRAGGDWGIVLEMVKWWVESGFELVVVKYKEEK